MKVGILGGTGPAGRGLGLRLALGGHEVVIGSRDRERAEQIVSGLRDSWGERADGLRGADNAGAADSEVVVLATPWDSALPTVSALAEPLAGRTVISMVVALVRQRREMLPLQLPRGSMAASVQAALPSSVVSAAFHHLPASEMEDLDSGLTADVLVCSDHPDGTAATVSLVEDMVGFRAVDAGSLAQASAIEAFTAVCISINMRHRVHSTVRMEGV